MIQVIAKDVLKAYNDLELAFKWMEGAMAAASSTSLVRGQSEHLIEQLLAAKVVCYKLDFVDSKRRVDMLINQLRFSGITTSVAHHEVHGLWLRFTQELCEVYFAFIPAGKLPFFENDNLFGCAVCEAFPEAVVDIKDAGNCIAAGLNTTAVFHLMRVIEYGLRAIAVKYRVKKVKSGKPITDATWGHILGAIRAKLDRVNLKRRQTRQQKNDADFYRFCLVECNLFKDHWRDDVMHTKGYYGEQDALALFQRVKDFINRVVNQGIKTG